MSFLANLKIPGSDLKRVSVIVLILTNLWPVFGVLFLGWQVFSILFLFWSENLIIGLSNIIKIILVPPDNKNPRSAKVFMIPFFCVHYGLFTMAHGMFIFAMFGGLLENEDLLPSLEALTDVLISPQIVWGVLALAVSHAVSLVVNYIGKGEYKKSNLSQLMIQPYGRVVILHVTIIIGSFLVALFDSPVVGLILLIALKTFIDIKTHLKQHSLFGMDKIEKAGTTS